MWQVRVLKGPQAGQVFELKPGPNKLGRLASCAVRLTSAGVSKEHALINITNDGVLLNDLGSANGTFINGVKVKNKALKNGDKIIVHDIWLEILELPGLASMPIAVGQNQNLSSSITTSNDASQAANSKNISAAHSHDSQDKNAIEEFIQTKVMPAIYNLAQTYDFRFVVGGILVAFILAITSLSVIPLSQVMRDSIEGESQKRAMTIAQGLADRYQIALANNTSSNFDTRFAEREDGVRNAFLISARDGSVLAPVTTAGQYAQEPFVHRARKRDQAGIEQVDSETIVAAVPVKLYDPNTGLQSPHAFSIVVYNMGALAVDDGRVFSLFIKVLAISLVLGAFVFLLLIRLIEAPINWLADQTDVALREGKSQVSPMFKTQEMERLALNISATLSRVGSSSDSSSNIQKNIYSEANQLLDVIMNPALAIDKSRSIIGLNQPLADLLQVEPNQFQASAISQLPDEALSSVLNEVLDRYTSNQSELQKSPLYFQGKNLELCVQPILGPMGVDYYIVTLKSNDGGTA